MISRLRERTMTVSTELPAGTFIKDVETYRSVEDDGLAGDLVVTFYASADGRDWQLHRAFDRLKLKRG